MLVKFTNYHRAQSLEDAHKTLQKDKSNTIVGGGLWLKLSRREVDTAVDLAGLDLDLIETTDKTIRIGAMTTLTQIEESDTLRQIASGILVEAVSEIMGRQLRNVATLGGSIIGRYGFSDCITPLLALDARLDFHERGIVSLQDFLTEKGKVDDILKAVVIDKTKAKGYFKKVKKTAHDFPILNVAVVKSEDGTRIAIGSRPAVATLAQAAMDHLAAATTIDKKTITQAARIAKESLKYSTNHRAGAEYRAHLAEVYTRRGLMEVNGLED